VLQLIMQQAQATNTTLAHFPSDVDTGNTARAFSARPPAVLEVRSGEIVLESKELIQVLSANVNDQIGSNFHTHGVYYRTLQCVNDDVKRIHPRTFQYRKHSVLSDLVRSYLPNNPPKPVACTFAGDEENCWGYVEKFEDVNNRLWLGFHQDGPTRAG